MTRASGLALMFAAPVLWSTAGVVTRHVERATPFETVFWRSLFAFLFVGLVVLALRRNPLKIGWPGLLSGALWGVMFTAFMIALSLTTTANTLVVMSISPLLTTLFASVRLRGDPVPIGTWVAAGAAALGIAWMFGSDLDAHTARDLSGMLVALCIPIAAATNVVTLRAAGARLDLRPAVMLGGAISCLVALPLALPLQATPKDVALLGFLGVFQLGLPCLFLVAASRVLLAPEMALIGLLEVVPGPLWAWLGAGEVPAKATLTGGAIVLGALIVNELATFRRIAPAATRLMSARSDQQVEGPQVDFGGRIVLARQPTAGLIGGYFQRDGEAGFAAERARRAPQRFGVNGGFAHGAALPQALRRCSRFQYQRCSVSVLRQRRSAFLRTRTMSPAAGPRAQCDSS